MRESTNVFRISDEVPAEGGIKREVVGTLKRRKPERFLVGGSIEVTRVPMVLNVEVVYRDPRTGQERTIRRRQELIREEATMGRKNEFLFADPPSHYQPRE